MAKGHRSQIKKERNEIKDKRPMAMLKHAKCSDRKARIVLEQIKGKKIDQAVAILTFSPRYAADLIKKVLLSAVANAEHNLNMDRETLFVEEVFANQGPTMKRIQPRAQGRAYKILKRSSHISIILNER